MGKPKTIYAKAFSVSIAAFAASIISLWADADILPDANIPPFASDDTYIVGANQVLQPPISGVLANDSDANSSHLTATLVKPPGNGALQLYPDGTFEYLPDNGFTGEDTFTYIANNGISDSNAATAYILVVDGRLEISLIERARERFNQQLTRVEEREQQGMLGKGLLQSYTSLFNARNGRILRIAPDNLYDLTQLLNYDPELLQLFVPDRDWNTRILQRQTLNNIDVLRLVYGRYLPELANEPKVISVDQRDILSEMLAVYDPDQYVVSGAPNETLAIPGNQGIEISPLGFSSLSTYGVDWKIRAEAAFDVNTEIVTFNNECSDQSMPCIWPVGWDYLPWGLSLTWESSTLSQQEMEAIVEQNGYLLSLSVNEVNLPIGEFGDDAGGGFSLTGFTASTLPGDLCPAGMQCLVTQVRARDKLRNIPPPWVFYLQVEKLEELDEPVIGEGPNGLPVLIHYEKVLFARASASILSNSTNATTYFEAALFPTFYSDRCTDCHSLDTPELLAEHHIDAGVGFGGVDNFLEYTKLMLEPSAYVPDGHVMTCENCHFIPTSHNGDPFHEIEWKTPYFDLDVNWYLKNAAQICSRVTANLPTPELRHDHFHEDARLHWAIENPKVMSQFLEPRAEPQDWDEFLARVDRWNQPGIDARCP